MISLLTLNNKILNSHTTAILAFIDKSPRYGGQSGKHSKIITLVVVFSPQEGVWWTVLLVVILSILIVVSYVVIAAHEQNTSFLTYQVGLNCCSFILSFL